MVAWNGACAGLCTAIDQCHVAGTCDPNTGACTTPAAPNGTTCDDGDFCTRADACQDGTCIGTSPVVCTASDQCHRAGVCDPSTGVCSDPPRPDGMACDYGTCTQNGCTPGACNDGACFLPTSCKAIHQAYPQLPDGIYWIDPDGAGPSVSFRVYCDMVTAGGGWTLITSISNTGPISGVKNSVLITPSSVNQTNRSMCLPGVTEILTVNDGQDSGVYQPPPPYAGPAIDLATGFDKAELYSGATGLFNDDPRLPGTIAWQQILDALNCNTGRSWFNQAYTQGVADTWQFDVQRVNTTGCLQTALRGNYGNGNHGGANSAGPSGVYSFGALWHHWGGKPGSPACTTATACAATRSTTTSTLGGRESTSGK